MIGDINFESRFDLALNNLKISVPILRSAGDQFPSFPHGLHALILRRRDGRGNAGGRRYRRRSRHAEWRSASQSIGVGYVACLMPRVRVTPLRVLLALAGGHRRVLVHLRGRRVDIGPGDLQHSLDIGGLGPKSRERLHVSLRAVESNFHEYIFIELCERIERDVRSK